MPSGARMPGEGAAAGVRGPDRCGHPGAGGRRKACSCPVGIWAPGPPAPWGRRGWSCPLWELPSLGTNTLFVIQPWFLSSAQRILGLSCLHLRFLRRERPSGSRPLPRPYLSAHRREAKPREMEYRLGRGRSRDPRLLSLQCLRS